MLRGLVIMKKIKISAIVLALSMLLCSCGKSTPKQSDMSKFRVTSYIIGSCIQDKESLHAEDFDVITDVILFECARFDENGDVIVDEEILTTALNNLREAIGDRDVKIHINLFGPDSKLETDDWNEKMNDKNVLHSKAFESETLISDLVGLVNKYDFDGLFFDYEYPMKKKYWNDFSEFLVNVDKELGEKLLGVAVVDWNIKFSKDAKEAIDRFEIMLYDNFDEDGTHSTYDICTKQSETFIKKGYDREKLDFGVPFYARAYDNGDWSNGYLGVYDKIDENGIATLPDVGKICVNTQKVISDKTKYAIDNGFGGMMIWHYNCDLASSDENSLLKAMNDTIESYK